VPEVGCLSRSCYRGQVSEAPRPPVVVELNWEGGQRLAGRAGSVPIVLDGDRQAGPSPGQALAASLAGCMALDVVHVLTKGRLDLPGVDVRPLAGRPPP